MENQTITLVRCPNCGRVVDEKWHNCVHCAFRLLNEDGTRRVLTMSELHNQTIRRSKKIEVKS